MVTGSHGAVLRVAAALCALPLTAAASTWIREYPPAVVERLTDVAATLDGGCVLAGLRPAAAGGSEMVVIKLDPDGNEVWAETLDLGTPLTPRDLRTAVDGSVWITGGAGTADGFLLKLDPLTGAVAWAWTLASAPLHRLDRYGAGIVVAGGPYGSALELAAVDPAGVLGLQVPGGGGGWVGGFTSGNIARVHSSGEHALSTLDAAVFDPAAATLEYGHLQDFFRCNFDSTSLVTLEPGGFLVGGWYEVEPWGMVPQLWRFDDHANLVGGDTEVWRSGEVSAMTRTLDGEVAVASSEGVVVSLWRVSLGGGMDVEWHEEYPAECGGYVGAVGLDAATDGGYYLGLALASAPGVSAGSRIAKTDSLGRVPGCSVTPPPPELGAACAVDVFPPAAGTFTTTSLAPAPVTATPSTVLAAGRAACPSGPGAIEMLRGVRVGDSARFEWQVHPGAGGYDLWYVESRVEIPYARLGGPPARPVAGCALPTPAPAANCTDAGAVPRSPALFFYQVRAVCGSSEGP